jgi:VIT1/CCC1 family predicted Fe2+/Mn2+ transporter
MTGPVHRHSQGERHLSGRAAWLRAAVLGANDGLLSTASLMMGVGAATPGRSAVLTAGLAAMAAGALAMAVGEYSSVSSQRDTELADLERERHELAATPEQETAELAAIYRSRGLSAGLSEQVAREMMAGANPLQHHAREELGLDLEALSRPGEAGLVSAISFALGALLPVLVVILLPISWRVPATIFVTLAGLGALGAVGARLGGAPLARAAMRVLIGGALALAVSTLVGRLVGAAV